MGDVIKVTPDNARTALAELPPDPTLMEEIEKFEDGDFHDPWSGDSCGFSSTRRS